MYCDKIGALIFRLRKEKGYTQKTLADMLNVSDRAVSKWERGQGCPDISIIPAISGVFGIDIEKLIRGELDGNDAEEGNMKKTKYYICPHCGNIILSTNDAGVSCCGRKLGEAVAKKAEDGEKLTVERTGNEIYVSSNHPMTKDHYISFVAFATGDSVQIIKKYPEWDLQCHLYGARHGMLLWYCTNHGLFYQNI